MPILADWLSYTPVLPWMYLADWLSYTPVLPWMCRLYGVKLGAGVQVNNV